MMKNAFISIVIPAHNEAHCIQRNLEKLVGYLAPRFHQFEILVVDDGSTDETSRKVAELVQKDFRIGIVSYPTNRGKGYAVRQGILGAKGDIILFMDADLSTPIEETRKAVDELLNGASVVLGSRQHPNSVILLHQSSMRERAGKMFNRLIRLVLPLSFRDTQCGFKAFCRKAAKEIFSMSRVDGFAFDVEVLLIAHRLGYAIKEIPVHWTDAPGSKVSVSRDLFSVIRELLTICINDRRGFYNRRTAGVLEEISL